MRMNDNFNIITGEYKPHVANITNNRRFTSVDVLRKMKENNGGKKEDASSIHQRRLGTPQDYKVFQYAYNSNDNAINQYQSSRGRFYFIQPTMKMEIWASKKAQNRFP